MREIPILFNTPMVQAIQDGRKTMTRRIVKPQPPQDIGKIYGPKYYAPNAIGRNGELYPGNPIYGVYDESGEWGTKCPHQPGDRLWVRETWAIADLFLKPEVNHKNLLEGELVWFYCGEFDFDIKGNVVYKADYPNAEIYKGAWRPSIHMPKAAARIWLEVADVKVKKLQDITEEDAKAEGVLPHGDNAKPHTKAFYSLWQKLYAAPKAVLQTINGKTEIISYVSYPWEDVHETREYKGKPWHVIGNPWVWVVEFRRVEHN